jgi:hypothetical protein
MNQRLSRVAIGVFLAGTLGACFSTDPEPVPDPPPVPTRAEVKLLVDPNPVRANYEGNGWYRFKVNLAFSESAGVGFTISTIRVSVSSALSGRTLLDASSLVGEHVAANGSKVLQFTCPQYHMELGTSAARTRFSASITDDKGNAITLSGQADVLHRGEPQRLP